MHGHGRRAAMVTPSDLAIATERRGERLVVRLTGDLDVSNRDELREVLDALLAAGSPHLVVDVSGLAFADCAGLSVLIEARERLAGRGRTLTVTAPQPIVRRLLEITGMDVVFRLGEDEHHAFRTRTHQEPSGRAG